MRNLCSPIHANLVIITNQLDIVSAVRQLGIGYKLLLHASHNVSIGSYVLQLGAANLGNLNLIVGAILEVDAYLPSDVLAAQSGLCLILDISDISYGRGGSCSFISVNNNAAYDNEIILVAGGYRYTAVLSNSQLIPVSASSLSFVGSGRSYLGRNNVELFNKGLVGSIG